MLKEYQIDEVDAILSSLPLAIIPDEIKHKIIDASYKALKPDGVFVQYQYSLNAKKLIETRFGKLKIHLVPMNLPPAFVYCGYK